MAKENPYRDLSDQKDYVIFHDVKIPMSDGVNLTADIYFPAENGEVDLTKQYASILYRIPYYQWQFVMNPYRIDSSVSDRGYVFVSAKIRGTDSSEGEFDPLLNDGWGEHKDGLETAAWIRKQPWSNGVVGAYGKSYMGGSALHLTLADGGASVDSLFLLEPASLYERVGWVYNGPFFEFNTIPYWCIMHIPDQMNHLPADIAEKMKVDMEEVGDPFADPVALFGILASWYKEHGLTDMPVLRHLPFWQKWLAARENPEVLSYADVIDRSYAIDKPVMVAGGWYDLFNKNSLGCYERFVRDAPSEEIAKASRLLVGPWGHVPPAPLARKFPGSKTYINAVIMDWMDMQLVGKPCKFLEDYPVTLYVMGENRWCAEQTWPLPDAVPTKFFLHSNGHANTLMGDGEISLQAPDMEEAPDGYTYDPSNPVPTLGGHTLMGNSCDQRQNELRPDILVYTSDPMEEDMEFTGYAKASICASTTGTDTDFFVKVIDVFPDGCAYNIVSGGNRGRYLAKGLSDPVALEPGTIYTWPIELPPTSYVLKKGHQLRVEITSSDFPNYDINPNQFIDLNASTAKDYVPAQQTVYHNANHPAWIELPVVSAEHERTWIDEWPYDQEDSSAVEFTTLADPTNPQPVKIFDGVELPRVD